MDIEQLNAILESIKNPGDDGVPETVYDDITSGFTANSDAMGQANAKIEQLEQEKQAILNEFNDYKLRMFDKLMEAPADESDHSGDNDTDESPSIDGLFKDEN